MLSWLWTRGRKGKSAKWMDNRIRELAYEALESRDLMAGIPQLSSLPGAARKIFLDFDGDFQAVWRRTDSHQTYTNVTAGEFNIDNTPGISAYEESAIRTIWETVADDYAPFNVNVTTISPASFGNGAALRVVMAGATSAVLRNSLGATMNLPTRDVFISEDNGSMVDTSGYASIGSFSDAEPNVVYVFAKYMSTWDAIDSENRYRDLRAIIANTASHEAGHAFGLEHHGDYDTGTNLTTPIMGSNTQGDRTLWSSYSVDGVAFDTRARLTAMLGARPDDYTGTLNAATNFPLSYSPIRGYSGTVKGVIGTTNDTDMFRLTTTSTNTYQMTVTVPQFGNLDSQLVFYMIRGGNWLVPEYLEQVFVLDPAIPQSSPFSGLGASATMQLPAGKWAIAVRSHGGYGDIGGYSLSVSIPSSGAYYDPGTLSYYAATTSPSVPSSSYPDTAYATNTAMMKSGGAGAEHVGALATPISNGSMLSDTDVERSRKKAKQEAIEAVFATWPSSRTRTL